MKIISEQFGSAKKQIRLITIIAVGVLTILQFTILPGALDFVTTLAVFGLGVLFNKAKEK